MEPLRTVAQRLGRVLAVAQEDVVRRAGGVAVPPDLPPPPPESQRTAITSTG